MTLSAALCVTASVDYVRPGALEALDGSVADCCATSQLLLARHRAR